MNRREVLEKVVRYCRQRDAQFAIYEEYARKNDMSVKALFILNVLYYSEQGCTQTTICERTFSSKQLVSATMKQYLEKGYVFFQEDTADRRNKLVHLTAEGRDYAEKIIPIVTEAECAAMSAFTVQEQETLLKLNSSFSDRLQSILEG